MQTSVDISQYVGQDQSIFRPVKRENGPEVAVGSDPISQLRHSGSRTSEPAIDIPENTRLLRSLAAGLIICVALALVQFVATKNIPGQLYVLPLGRGTSIVTVLKYGIGTGLVLGLGLGALLTKFKKGSFLGLVVGAMVAFGFNNWPWAQIAGALTGILAGRFATYGLRRTVQL
jgi:hypothetical protein